MPRSGGGKGEVLVGPVEKKSWGLPRQTMNRRKKNYLAFTSFIGRGIRGIWDAAGKMKDEEKTLDAALSRKAEGGALCMLLEKRIEVKDERSKRTQRHKKSGKRSELRANEKARKGGLVSCPNGSDQILARL